VQKPVEIRRLADCMFRLWNLGFAGYYSDMSTTIEKFNIDRLAVFKSQFAAPVPPHKNAAFVMPHMITALTRAINGEIDDVNTAIRESEEAANKEIAEKGI
jgi:hypothetical protein